MRSFVLVAVAVFVCSCGGSSTPTSPSAPPAPSPTPTPQPVADGFTFRVEAGVSPADESVIREGHESGQTFFRTTFGKVVPGNVTVQINAGGGDNPASTSATLITFNTGHQVWSSSATVSKRKIAIHELFHVFQNRYGFISNPRWFIEGSAEYVGYQGIASLGLLPFQTAKGCMMFSAAHSSSPIPTLLNGGIPDNNGYWLAFLAIDFMARGNLATFASMVNQNSSSWDGKMTPVNGMSVDQFYDAFEVERSNFRAPANYECPR